jgi:hypothetical protein
MFDSYCVYSTTQVELGGAALEPVRRGSSSKARKLRGRTGVLGRVATLETISTGGGGGHAALLGGTWPWYRDWNEKFGEGCFPSARLAAAQAMHQTVLRSSPRP